MAQQEARLEVMGQRDMGGNAESSDNNSPPDTVVTAQLNFADAEWWKSC